MDILPQKQCTSCNNFFPATSEFFHRQKSSKDGLKPLCKRCQKEYQSAYYASHREEISEQRKGYYQRNQEHLRQYSAQYRIENPDTVRQSSKRYNKEHREERLTAKARYNAAHREERIEYAKNWHAENKEAQRLYAIEYNTTHREERLQYYRQRRAVHREELNARYRQYRHTEHGRLAHRANQNRRRARQLEAPGFYTAQDVQKQYERQKGRCYYCSARFGRGKRAYHVDHIIPLSRSGSNAPDNLVLACEPCNLRKNDKLLHEWEDGGRLL